MSKGRRYQATTTKGLPLEVLVIPFRTLQEAMVISTALNTNSVNTRVLFDQLEWVMARECEVDYCVVKV